MDYKNLYLKYKTKYLELKGGLNGGLKDISKCDAKFQDLMDIKIEDKDYKIYQGSINESNCNLDDLYAKCKLYLDTLTKIHEFILWIYTDGALARLLNNYLLKDRKIDEFYFKPYTIYSICLQIKWYYFFEMDKIDQENEENKKNEVNEENKKNEVNEDSKKMKTLFETIILLIWINFKKINKKISKDNKLDDSDKKLLTQIMTTINNASPKLSDSDKVGLLKPFFINYKNEFVIEFIIDYVINDIEKLILVKFIDLNLSVLTKILDGAPGIDRCIKLYKIIGNNTDLYEIGKTYKQKVINSLTCSRTANISIFYDREKEPCCLLEINCKVGTKILFLNYLKTIYGSNMSEVILPFGYDFKVEASDIKDIITYDFESKITKPKTKQIQPLIDIKYKDPKIKKIKVYEIIII